MKLLESHTAKHGQPKKGRGRFYLNRCVCGKEIVVNGRATRKWCSTECARRSKGRYVECAWCGEEFHSLNGEAKYCCETHAHLCSGWGSRERFEDLRRQAVDMLLNGSTRKQVWQGLSISSQALKRLVSYTWGADWWCYWEKNAVKPRKQRKPSHDEQMLIKGSEYRQRLAGYLKLIREYGAHKPGSVKRAAETLGMNIASLSPLLNKHTILYKKYGGLRRQKSKWKRKELRLGRLTKLFDSEEAFVDHVAELMAKADYKVRREVTLDGYATRRRLDIVAMKGDIAYCIEAKATNRTNCEDAMIGQALLKSWGLEQQDGSFVSIAVVMLPSDLSFSSVALGFCKQSSPCILCANELNVVDICDNFIKRMEQICVSH